MKYIFQIPIFLLMLWASGVSYAGNIIVYNRQEKEAVYLSSTDKDAIVGDLIGPIPDAAAFANQNLMFVQDLNSINTSLVWAHEIGHLLWYLLHPEHLGFSDSDSWMKDKLNPRDQLMSKHEINFFYLIGGFGIK